MQSAAVCRSVSVYAARGHFLDQPPADQDGNYESDVSNSISAAWCSSFTVEDLEFLNPKPSIVNLWSCMVHCFVRIGDFTYTFLSPSYMSLNLEDLHTLARS